MSEKVYENIDYNTETEKSNERYEENVVKKLSFNLHHNFEKINKVNIEKQENKVIEKNIEIVLNHKSIFTSLPLYISKYFLKFVF
jgi:hypothetical protein